MGGNQKSKAGKGGAAQSTTSSHSPTAAEKKRMKAKEAAKVADKKARKKAGAGKENESPASAPAAASGGRTGRKTASANDNPASDDPPRGTPAPLRAAAATPTNKTAGAKTNRSARDLELARLKRIEALYEEEQAKQKKQKKQAVKRVQKAVQQQLDDEDDSITIPRPQGSAGKEYSLQVAMGLANRREKYKATRLLVKRCIDRAGLDYKLHMHEQDVVKLGSVYKAARAAEPLLKRYARDWATKDFVAQLLRNRRQDDRKRAENLAKEEAAAAEAAQDPELDDFGTDEEVQDDESGSDED